MHCLHVCTCNHPLFVLEEIDLLNPLAWNALPFCHVCTPMLPCLHPYAAFLSCMHPYAALLPYLNPTAVLYPS
jgi:hypothetical protein